MPFIEEIGERLETRGVAAFGETMFASGVETLPETGNCLSLKETGGSESTVTHNDTAVANLAMQLTARGTTWLEARTLAKAAWDALGGDVGLYNITLGGTFYLKIKTRQNLTDLGRDVQGRAMVVFNIAAEKQPS